MLDDDEVIRDMLSAVLKAAGHQVRTASDGNEAFRLYRDHGPFDVVLSDLEHPGMGGAELVAAILKIRPEQRYAFVPGHPVLRKPFEMRQLVDLVRELGTQRTP